MMIEHDHPYSLVRLSSDDVERAVMSLLAENGIVPSIGENGYVLLDFRAYDSLGQADIRWIYQGRDRDDSTDARYWMYRVSR